jgi:hypothetical protein
MKTKLRHYSILGIIFAFASAVQASDATTGVFNPLDFGASGRGKPELDAPAMWRCFQAMTNAGAGTMWLANSKVFADTNTYLWPSAPAGAYTIQGAGNSVIKVLITNATYITCKQNMPDFINVTFQNAGSGSNICVMASRIPGDYHYERNARFVGWAIPEYYGANASPVIMNAVYEHCRVCPVFAGWSDAPFIKFNAKYCRFGVVVAGDYNTPPWGFATRVNGGTFMMGGIGNGYTLIIGRSGSCNFSGNSESNTNAMIAIGYPPDLFPGDSHYCATQALDTVIISGVSELVNQISPSSRSNALINFFVPVRHMTVIGTQSGSLFKFENQGSYNWSHIKTLGCQTHYHSYMMPDGSTVTKTNDEWGIQWTTSTGGNY